MLAAGFADLGLSPQLASLVGQQSAGHTQALHAHLNGLASSRLTPAIPMLAIWPLAPSSLPASLGPQGSRALLCAWPEPGAACADLPMLNILGRSNAADWSLSA